MPRTCSICTNAKVNEINAALIDNAPSRTVAQRFRVSRDAVQRHKAHIPQTLAKAKEAREEVAADTLFERLKSLNREALAILSEERIAKNNRVALDAIGEAARLLQIEAKLLGELDESTKIAVGVQVNSTAADGWDYEKMPLNVVEQVAYLWEKWRKR